MNEFATFIKNTSDDLVGAEVQSKTTYATEATAMKQGQKAKGSDFTGTHQLPSGRFCYTYVSRLV